MVDIDQNDILTTGAYVDKEDLDGIRKCYLECLEWLKGFENVKDPSNSLQELSELATNPDDFSSDIPSLKKRIKYCKNPLERKSLERQLNAAYKKMKKRRC